MNKFREINALMVQLGTSCAFDSPGLARNEPTLGKYSQRDSTPEVLSVFCEGMVIVRGLIECYANIPMNKSATKNVLTMQLGTSCSFDSPGLARNEPTLGKYSQGDSTP